mgnify:CR=1 FL=1
MIKTEYYKTLKNGTELVRTYSTTGLMIERDGIRYAEAIDPAELGRTYTEADAPVEPDMTELEEKAKAYDILMGVTE